MAVLLFLLSFAAFFCGFVCCFCGALLYKIPVEYMQIVGNERRSGWQFGYLGFNIDIPPKIDNAVNFSTKVYDTGELQIPTPDDGILGVTASVVYMPDSRNILNSHITPTSKKFCRTESDAKSITGSINKE
jgi:hypothetical protein